MGRRVVRINIDSDRPYDRTSISIEAAADSNIKAEIAAENVTIAVDVRSNVPLERKPLVLSDFLHNVGVETGAPVTNSDDVNYYSTQPNSFGFWGTLYFKASNVASLTWSLAKEVAAKEAIKAMLMTLCKWLVPVVLTLLSLLSLWFTGSPTPDPNPRNDITIYVLASPVATTGLLALFLLITRRVRIIQIEA